MFSCCQSRASKGLDTLNQDILPEILQTPPRNTPRAQDFLPNNTSEFVTGRGSNINELTEGTMIKQYRLKGVLGEGMQGQVRIATDPSGRDWAMKIVKKRSVFRRGKEGKYGLATGQVAREIAIMKKLVHINLVSLHEVLDDPNEDKLFLVMEFVTGGPVMQDKLEGQEPLAEDLARSYFRQLISGLVLKKLMGFGSTIIRAFITSKGNATNQKQMPAIPPAASALTFLDLVPHERDSKKF